MNPFTGGLKFLGTTAFNAVLALLFFLFAARYETPAFVGKVAILQLLEVIVGSFLTVMPYQVVSREAAHAKGLDRKEDVSSTALGQALLVSPVLLFLFLFPSYLWMGIPYFVLYLYSTYQSSILQGMGLFTEANVGNVAFSLGRWGLSTIAVVERSVPLLILVWTAGAAAKTVYYQLHLERPSFSLKVFGDVFRTGVPVYITNAVAFLSGQGDRVTTAYLLGSFSLGIYQFAALLAGVPALLLNSLWGVVLPGVTYYTARGVDVRRASSLTLRLYFLLSLPLAAIGVGLAPPLVRELFPQYVPGLTSLELLVLFVTATSPFIALSNVIIAAKRDYRPLALIGVVSAAEVVVTSLLLIPRMGILGAALSQVGNTVLTSALYLYFTVEQGLLSLGRRELVGIGLFGATFVSLWNPWIAFVLVLLGAKLGGLISRADLTSLRSFIPPSLSFLGRVIEAMALDW
ncbi:polysaccharide biosynthesis protein [Sulfodiicoccus acidiphilus]|uniref:Polysaccharide biosynthesis protein n=1 Tax=Sulfodiicoccus acidiphilus TaxID=1670455 RepID=A0A348B5M4_9CREN|nr:oligosaccharide flippase family protein [Sulfodiicoccus acidiphilus]BBD73476.1 polysaccharide biosynthesis protein [Sulfodiicoccus acidiphilus]GGT92863.1 polysaccharide biosynthesis protein [Sulfodiicoccus acidiphilus]